jgi:signal peptidase I
VAERSSLGGTARGIRDLVVIVLLALVASSLVRAFVMQPFSVPTGSMEHTIQTHQRILVGKVGQIERGEVVVFVDPGGWLPPSGSEPGLLRRGLEWAGLAPSSAENHLVKRVIGMPGDRVVCCDERGRVSVNDQPLDEGSYLFDGDAPSRSPFDVTVPDGSMWVMGDHRSNSGDSRCHLADGTGFVSLDLVTGRAVATVWPLDELHALGVPSTFDTIPEPAGVPAEPVVTRPSTCPGGAAL